MSVGAADSSGAGAGVGSVIAEPGAASGWAETEDVAGRAVLLAMAETLARHAPRRTTRWYVRRVQPGYRDACFGAYSHSIVAGGLELMS